MTDRVKRGCSFDPCERVNHADGYCRAHYIQRKRGKPLTSLRKRRRVLYRDGEKLCTACGEYKNVEEFTVARSRPDGREGMCRGCAGEYRRANRDAIWSSQLARYYNMTLERFKAMLLAQNAVCAICAEACATGKRLSVDHDHACCPGSKSCGECVRGLLCTRCNAMIGYAHDRTDLLESAIVYLGKYSARTT